MKIATIFNTPDTSWIELVTPYDEDFIDDLKMFIDKHNRKWVPDTTSWRVRISEKKFLTRLLNDHGFAVREEHLEYKTTGSVDGNLFEQVLTMIPDDYVNKVYYALAQAVHPDHGGTSEQMKQLNNAYEKRSKNGK
jgi:hypothetical protein